MQVTSLWQGVQCERAYAEDTPNAIQMFLQTSKRSSHDHARRNPEPEDRTSVRQRLRPNVARY